MERHPQGLIFFDVEGVFFPRKRSLLLEVTRNLPAAALIKLLIYILAYWLRLMDADKLVTSAYRNLKGASIQRFMDTYSKLPLTEKAEETITNLRRNGYLTALASSGLPQQVVDNLKAKVGADFAFGVKVELDAESRLTGRIEIGNTVRQGKLTILERLSRELKISADMIYIVADDRNNLQLLKAPHKLFIGFNPDGELKARSDMNVTGNNLYPILNIIANKAGEKSKIFSRRYIIRKLIHISGVATIFLAALLGTLATQLIILFVLAFYLTGEYLRLSRNRMPVIASITQTAATDEELGGIALNPMWLALGILLVLTIFPLGIAAIGILALCIGDSVAGIVGEALKRKHRYSFNRAKSIEGTVIGLLATAPLSMLFVNPFIGLIACGVGMVFEFLPLPANDNLTIPFLTSLTVSLLTNPFIFT